MEIAMTLNVDLKQTYISQNTSEYKYIVAIGISTGGPSALQKLVTDLTPDLDAVYIVVQHMPEHFTKILAERLNAMSALTIKEAEDREVLKRGHMYIAPGGRHFEVTNRYRPTVRISDEPPYKRHKPSVNRLFLTLAKIQSTKHIIGVIMTGMGSDGLEGLQALKQMCDATIVAQNEATCVVYGMPKVAVEAGIADYVVPLQRITDTIQKIMGE